MSDETENFGCGALIATAFFAFFVGLGVGGKIEDHLRGTPMRAKAVEMGAAEWKLDLKTGRTEFKWKEQQ